MRKIPKIRCPICGHIVFLRNVAPGLHHRMETFVVKIKGLGRGKGFENKYESEVPEGLADFWIRRLEEVINWLKEQKSQKNVYLSLPTGQKASLNLDFPVSEKSVLQIRDSKSPSLKMQTQNVPKEQQSLYLQETPTLSLTFQGKALLKQKKN